MLSRTREFSLQVSTLSEVDETCMAHVRCLFSSGRWPRCRAKTLLPLHLYKEPGYLRFVAAVLQAVDSMGLVSKRGHARLQEIIIWTAVISAPVALYTILKTQDSPTAQVPRFTMQHALTYTENTRVVMPADTSAADQLR